MYVFPVLTTPNISKNILLAVCRTLERYLLIYETDLILQRLGAKTGENISLRQGRLVNVTHEQSSQIIKEAKPSSNKPDPDPDDEDEEFPEDDSKKRKHEVKIDLPKRDAMTLEPTYMTIDHPRLGKQILAIKALPFQVKSEEMLIQLLRDDYSAGIAVRILRTMERGIVRWIWRIIRGIMPWSGIRNKAVTGDVEKDVIYGMSGHSVAGKDVFVLIDQASLQKEITIDAPHVKKLFKMYWPSFVVVDEIEKTATYCMEGFNGLCSTIHYPYLLTSIGKEHQGVYEDLEEVRKASSQFFRLSTNKQKVLECSCIGEKNKQLSELTRGGREVLIEDDILPIVNKLTDPVKVEKIFNHLKLSLSQKNDDLAYQALDNIPSFSVESIEKFGRKGSPNFLTIYDKIQTVLTNSTKIPENLIKPISLMLAIKSSYKVANSKKETKDILLRFVPIIRKLRITKFPVRIGVQVFLDTLGNSDKAGLAAGLLLLKIYLDSIKTPPEKKEETDDGSSV
jgi:hypothetical protein